MSQTPAGAPDATSPPVVHPGDGSLAQDAQERCRRRSTISGASGLVAVLGDPVRHSLSPAMHNAALQELGLDWVYMALRTPPGRLAAVLAGLESVECRGLNITLPHKAEAAQLAQELSPLAARLGAVNTLVPRAEGGWFGTNTDVEGFLAPLRSGGVSWQGQQALVLGNGGSARAIVAALTELGLAAILVAGRRQQNLDRLLQACGGWAPTLEGVPWSAGPLRSALGGSALVVNTTPVGMASSGDPEPAASPLNPSDLDALQQGATVYDLIYTPRPTALLQQAKVRGCRTIDGLEMLVQQGAASLQLWTGQAVVPVNVMRQAALEQLAAQSPTHP
ncbi:MAG: shikimate dehydrogenase [Cyanobacteria bacterium]|nr:shikimate dehydrogenase [Cyanobacteriota bacterium]